MSVEPRNDRSPTVAGGPRIAPHRRARLIIVLLFAVVLPGGAAVLRWAPPTESVLYPRCVFKVMTGFNCPGCGATRCLHSLVIGDIAQAFAYNPLLLLGLPFLSFAAILESYAAWTGQRLANRRLPSSAILAIFWLLLAFGIARNIDIYPFTLLGPRALVLE